jgi:7-keto-8-aminopelargonate synthetase-like enzyme
VEKQVELQMGTLSKAVGLSGGYLAASKAVVEWLINRARSFIYSTAMPPSQAAAAAAAVTLLLGPAGDERRRRLRENVAYFREQIGLPEPQFSSAIVPVLVGDEVAAVQASEALRERGFWIPAIRYPTVARGQARLRVTLSAQPSQVEIAALAAALRAVL